MLVDVVEVEPRENYVLWLKFEDGVEGIVDIRHLLGEFSGVFSNLKDPKYFENVRVDPEIGTVSWSGKVDLCQDVLYAAVLGMDKPDLSSALSA